MRAAFDHYCEAHAASDDVIPEPYFGHHLIDRHTKTEATRARWIDLAIAVQQEA